MDTRQFEINCPNCGTHRFSFEAGNRLEHARYSPEQRGRIAHGIYPLDRSEVVGTEFIERLANKGILPPAVERIDNLLRYLAARPLPFDPQRIRAREVRAAIGAATEDQARWVIEEAIDAKLLKGVTHPTHTDTTGWELSNATLTMEGWKRYDALMRSAVDSQHAFMAMDFNEPAAKAMFEILKGAVSEAGFTLRTTEHPEKTAGLIDTRMRVEIRTSRFLVCDLSHGNRGAYWEAGFAEGLGRPVFYVCDEAAMASDDKMVKPHFDTDHQLIVKWYPNDPTKTADELKALIRNTLNQLAKMEDGTAAR